METITIVNPAHIACTDVSMRPQLRSRHLSPAGYVRPNAGAPTWMSSAEKSALIEGRFAGVFVGTDAHQGPNTWGPPV